MTASFSLRYLSRPQRPAATPLRAKQYVNPDGGAAWNIIYFAHMGFVDSQHLKRRTDRVERSFQSFRFAISLEIERVVMQLFSRSRASEILLRRVAPKVGLSGAPLAWMAS